MTTTIQSHVPEFDPPRTRGIEALVHTSSRGNHNGVRRRSRRAVAAAEFAVCLPILVLLVFGSIEASSFIFLKQALSVAAYEGAREAALSNSTATAAEDRATHIGIARPGRHTKHWHAVLRQTHFAH